MKEKVSPTPIYLRLREVLPVINDKQLAELLGVTQQSVNGWKRKGKIKRDRIETAARLSGVSYAWLLTGEGEKYPARKLTNAELETTLQREASARSMRSESPLPFRSLPWPVFRRANCRC